MIIIFALLYPLLASSGLLDSLPSFSELMSGSFLNDYFGSENTSISYSTLFDPALIQSYLPQLNALVLNNDTELAQTEVKIDEKVTHQEQDRRKRRQHSKKANVTMINKQYRSGINRKGVQRHNAVDKRRIQNQPQFVKRNQLRNPLANTIRHHPNSQVNKQRNNEQLLRRQRNARKIQNALNIDHKLNQGRKKLKVMKRQISKPTTKRITYEIDDNISIIDASDNLNKSFYIIASNVPDQPNITTIPDDIVTIDDGLLNLDEVNHTTTFQIGNNTMVQTVNTYQGEVLVEGIEDIKQQQNFVTKHIEHCPASGFVLKKDQQGDLDTCYLCFCRQNKTAICWPRNNEKCDNDHYQHNVERRIHNRVRRSPFSIQNLFFKEATSGLRSSYDNAEQECKPHESSKSEGCPPVDWCVGCSVCDCDARGQWECHLLSFCSDDDKRKKHLRDIILSTTPRVDKAVRKMAQQQVQKISAARISNIRRKVLGKDLRSRYFFKNGTVMNKTLFDTRKRVRSPRLQEFNATQLQLIANYNLKVRNKTNPELLKRRYAVVSGKKANKVRELNMVVRGIADKRTKETIAQENEKAKNILAHRKLRSKSNKKKIFVPAGLKLPDKLKSSRFRNLIGELPKEITDERRSQKVKRNSVKSSADETISHDSQTKEIRKSKRPTRLPRKVNNGSKRLRRRKQANVSYSRTGLRMIRQPTSAPGAKNSINLNGRTYNKLSKRSLQKKNVTRVSPDNSKIIKKNKLNKQKNNTTKPSPKKNAQASSLKKISSSRLSPYLKIVNSSSLRTEKKSKGATKQKPSSGKSNTKKPELSTKLIKSTPMSSTKAIQIKLNPEKVSNTLSFRTGNNSKVLHTKQNSKSEKPTANKQIHQAKQKVNIQKVSIKKEKAIKTFQPKVNDTLKNTPQMNQMLSKDSKRKVKRSVPYESPYPTSQKPTNIQDIFRRSHNAYALATELDKKQNYNLRDNELNLKNSPSSILPGSHKIWLRSHHKTSSSRVNSRRVAKVIKSKAHEEINDTRRLSVPFIRSNRHIPSSNHKDPRHIPVSNLYGYIRSQNRKNSEDQLSSLINNMIQNTLDVRNSYYKTTVNRNLDIERPRIKTTTIVPNVNDTVVPNVNRRYTGISTKYAPAYSDRKSLYKRQKREVHKQATPTLVIETGTPQETQKNPAIQIKPTNLLSSTKELNEIPIGSLSLTTSLPSEIDYYKYTVEETTNKLNTMHKTLEYDTETVILYNKNTEAKRSVDRHLPMHDFIFNEKLNQSNVKTRSVTEYGNDTFVSSALSNETFSMIEGIRDFAKYSKIYKRHDDQMTSSILTGNEIRVTGGDTIQFSQDIIGLPVSIKTPSKLGDAVFLMKHQNYSSQMNDTESITESLQIEPMTSVASETNYVGAENLFKWMPAETSYIDGDKKNFNETSSTARYSANTGDLLFKYNMIENISDSTLKFSTEQTKDDDSKMYTGLKNFAVPSGLDNFVATERTETNYHNIKNTTTQVHYNYIPLGILYQFKNKKVGSTERSKGLKTKIQYKEDMLRGDTTNITSTSRYNDTENKTITDVFTPNITVTENSIANNNTKIYMSVPNNFNNTAADIYLHPKNNLRSYEIKKLSIKNKHQLKKIVPTLYANKKREEKLILTNEFSTVATQNTTNDLKNIFKTLLSGINIRDKKKNNPKAKRFKILKYLQKFFKTMFANGGKNNTKNLNLNSTINKKNIVETLCSTFGPCNINVKNKAKLRYQIDHLNIETYNMLRSIKIIKGLLKLVDFAQNDRAGKSTNMKSNFKTDVQKLRAILKNTYIHDSFDTLTETQKTQIAYIKNNTQNFIQSAAKFTMVLNEIINIIGTSEQKSNEITNKCRKRTESDRNNYLKTNAMRLRSDVSMPPSLKKLIDLITKYNFVQNSFMRKIYKILAEFYPKSKDTKANFNTKSKNAMNSNRTQIIKKKNKTEAIQIYTKNIIQNLRKLKALAQNVIGNVRRKRNILKHDESVEYMLMMMEFLLKQNNQLDVQSAGDGIDLLLEAINSSPDIRTIEKKVLQEKLHTEEIHNLKNPISSKLSKLQNAFAVEQTKQKFRATSLPSIEENMSDSNIKETKENNFTSKMEDSLMNIIDQSDDEEVVDVYKQYERRKSSKRPIYNKNLQAAYKNDSKKLPVVNVNLSDTKLDVLNMMFTKKSTTEPSTHSSTDIYNIIDLEDESALKIVASKSSESGNKDDGDKDGTSDQSKVYMGDDELEKNRSTYKDELLLTTSESFIQAIPDSVTEAFDDSLGVTMRSEWVDETYEDMREDLRVTTSTPATTFEDYALESLKPYFNITGVTKQTVPFEILDFEKHMQDDNAQSDNKDSGWQNNVEQEFERIGQLTSNVKETESNDKDGDEESSDKYMISGARRYNDNQ